MLEILENFIFQLLFSVGIIVAFGIIIALLNKAFHKLIGKFGSKVEIATGIIGTPVHELGHAFFCLLFGHKIVSMKLFSPDSETGTLGYVEHSYNKKNLYHQVGNFFIGVGPIIFGSLVLLLIMFLAVPNLLSELSDTMNLFYLLKLDLFSISTYTYIGEIIGDIVSAMFSFSNLTDFRWWIFIVLCSCIALHMNISPADIKSSVIGFLFIAALLLVVDVILYFVSYSTLTNFTYIVFIGSSYIINFLIVSVLMSLILVSIAGIVKGISLIIIKK